MTIEIVDFPINSMVIFHSYVRLPEGIHSDHSAPTQLLTFPRRILASLLTIKSLAGRQPLTSCENGSDTFSSAQAAKSDFEHLVASQSHGLTSRS